MASNWHREPMLVPGRPCVQLKPYPAYPSMKSFGGGPVKSTWKGYLQTNTHPNAKSAVSWELGKLLVVPHLCSLPRERVDGMGISTAQVLLKLGSGRPLDRPKNKRNMCTGILEKMGNQRYQ